MNFTDLLRDTLGTLWAHKRRTLLTMFGIAWGIISITMMVAAGEGLGDGIQKNQETFGKDVMIVFAGRTSMQAGGTRSGRLIRWLEDDYIQVAKEAPACKYVMPELGNGVQVRSLFNSGSIQVVGALPPFAEIRSVATAQGRFYNDEDNTEARNVAFLGSDTKKQLFAERDAVGQTVWMNGIPYTVIVGMEIFMGAVGIATLFLGGLSVMNVMLVSVRERTREIGVRMALGATRRSILRQFFLETIFVVAISGGIGLIISYGFCGLVNLAPMPPFFSGMLTNWKIAVMSIALLGVISILSALYPANRAASVDPIEALRFEAGG